MHDLVGSRFYYSILLLDFITQYSMLVVHVITQHRILFSGLLVVDVITQYSILFSGLCYVFRNFTLFCSGQPVRGPERRAKEYVTSKEYVLGDTCAGPGIRNH